MVASRSPKGAVYRGSSGFAQFRRPDGQVVKMYADDARVVAEIKRRGLWKQAEPHVAIGSTFLLKDVNSKGVDIFLWVGLANDGGFSWFSFPGATLDSPALQEFVDIMLNSLVAGMPPDGVKGGAHGPACS